jgi:DNA-directed RNA polymerase alpha subunit
MSSKAKKSASKGASKKKTTVDSSRWVESLSIQNNKISFDIQNRESNISIPFVNAIRRIILSEIACYGIEKGSVQFFENSSIYNNQFLEHRLTLIPIISDREGIPYEEIEIECSMRNTDEYIMNIFDDS